MDESLLGGSLLITYAPGCTDALLTVRGKDHDMTSKDLRDLAKAAERVARAMERDGN